MKEHDIQNLIRLELCQKVPGIILFRANVGQAWTGTKVIDNRGIDGTVLIYEARPFSTGLPQGFSDLFGVIPGGRAAFLEVKGPKGRVTNEQMNFLSLMLRAGAAAGIARSVDDALFLIDNPSRWGNDK